MRELLFTDLVAAAPPQANERVIGTRNILLLDADSADVSGTRNEKPISAGTSGPPAEWLD